jgi:hypothetical protein
MGTPERNVIPLPSSPSAPPPAHADDGFSTAGWLREMREMRREQQTEREHQTEAFVGALDKLGTRIDQSVTDLRSELRRHLNVLVATFVLSFVVLGGLAGLTIYFKGLGLTASATASAPAEPATVTTAP